MILCLDVGNTTMHGGLFAGDELRTQFRKSTSPRASSDEIGVFLCQVLERAGLEPAAVRQVALCSVVPDAVFSLRGACVKYLGVEPFVLQAGVKTGLKIRYHNPLEVGADRIADAIAAVALYPGRPLVVVDFGTATTLDAISAAREYLGGVIVPGVRTMMESLEQHTARLPAVEIAAPATVIGRTTIESIQSGLYHGQIALVRELARQIAGEAFGATRPVVLGTGGFAALYEGAGLFDRIVPDLVLRGLVHALRLNASADRR